MNESMDRVLADWLHEGPERGPREGLERSLAATRRIGQRPGWTLPERWLPMDISARVVPTTRLRRRQQLGVLILITILLAATLIAYVGSQQRRLPEPFGLAGNGAIVVAKDGDLFITDRPGGELRPLVAGPENDHGPMFSPDGTRLAFLRDTPQGSFHMVADADGTDVVTISPLGPKELEDLGRWSFAPDGRSLMAFGRNGAGVFIRPVDPTAAPTALDFSLGGSMILSQSGGPSFNPTKATEILVTGQRDAGPRGIYVYDLATGGIRTVREPVEDGEYFFDVAWLPDGEHITYRSTSFSSYARVVAADGSGDKAFDALRGQVSPISNAGTRIVAERAEDGDEGLVIVPIDGDGEVIALECGPGTAIECPRTSEPVERRSHWVWSPDDSMLIAIVLNIGESPTPDCDNAPSCEDGPVWNTYLQVDATTGQVTELDWPDVGGPAWQRVAP